MSSWYIQAYTNTYCDILVLVCRTPVWLSLLIHTASWKTIMIYPWKTVGMLDPSSSSLATYAQSVEARWMAGVAAMCMRSTSGCGSLDGASRNWVDSMWRKRLKDRRLPKMIGSGVDWRLVDN